jgi:hypothetical protein
MIPERFTGEKLLRVEEENTLRQQMPDGAKV